MSNLNIKGIIGLVLLLGVGGFALAYYPTFPSGSAIRPQILPSVCANLQVPPGNKVFSHVYAQGVQVYRWNGAGWDFVAPLANLFADAGFNGRVGFHYAGPTWETNSGSRVIARRAADCTPNPNAIPWLLVQTVLTERPGVFSNVTYVQQVNTVGGFPPTAPGANIGAEARVPYTAEYYFYRAHD